MTQQHLTILKENNIKITPQRLSILELLEHYGHMSTKEIFSKIQSKFPSISLATIYKNINFMLEKRLLKEVKLSNLDSKYEIAKEAHAHMVCSKCHHVYDVELNIDAAIERFQKENGFSVESNSVELVGLCPHCK